MGKSNSKIPPQLAKFNPPISPPRTNKPSSLQRKILKSEKRMIIYNICPPHLDKVRNYKGLQSLISKRKHHIKSIRIDPNSPLLSRLPLVKIFHRLRGLTSIEVEYSRENNITPDTIQFFARSLSTLKQLKSVSIRNDDPDDVSLKLSPLFFTYLSKLRSLKQVDLAWTSWMVRKAHEKAIQSLFLKAPRLAFVDKYGLDFSSCGDLTNGCLRKFGVKLKKKLKMRELKLDFRYGQRITMKGIHLLLDNLTGLDLTSFDLKIGGNKISHEQEVFLISSKISKMQKLQTLSLTFEGLEDIQHRGLRHLVENLNLLKSLSALKLDFSGCKDLGNFEAAVMVENIAFFEHLRHLHLNFSNGALNDLGVEYLSKTFSRLTNVEELHLIFKDQEALGNNGLASLSTSVSRMEKLKSLEMDFSTTIVNDQGLDVLGQKIAMLKELKQLKLCFATNEYITDKGAFIVVRRLEGLEKLTRLELDFSHCSHVKEEGVISVIRAMSMLRSVPQPKLKFYNCGEFKKGTQAMLKSYA